MQTHPLSMTAAARRTMWHPAAIVFAAFFFVQGCASKSAPPAAAPTPAAAPVPTVMQTCPDPTDGPSIVVNAVDEAHRAWIANPTTPLPPVCVLTAFARVAGAPDSLNAEALALAAEMRRRGPTQRELLSTEVILLARARRYADVSRTYDQLVAVDSQPAIDVSRLAIIAARQRSDTAALVRVLARASTTPGAGPAVRTELNVVRQVPQLWAAINEARGLIRQNPRYVAGYPSLVGNFGTLGMPDSVVAYIRRALGQGAARNTLTTPVETLVSTMLRHATLYGSLATWDAQIAAATRVDSALTSPSTKFLVAALIIQSSEPRIAEVSALVDGTLLSSRQADPAVRQRDRAAGCQRITPLLNSLNVADARLRAGGNQYAGGGVAQFTAGLAAARTRLTELQESCTRPTH